jgi:hypothetical protein
VQYLQSYGLNAGRCGGVSIAALRKLLANDVASGQLSLDKTAVVVLVGTEGVKEYKIPQEDAKASGL